VLPDVESVPEYVKLTDVPVESVISPVFVPDPTKGNIVDPFDLKAPYVIVT